MLERQELPQPIRYNRKLVRWRTRDIEAYVAARRQRLGKIERAEDAVSGAAFQTPRR